MMSLCERCCERVEAAERQVPVPGAFHAKCFTCSKSQCGRELSAQQYGVHKGQLFCANCFMSLVLSANGVPPAAAHEANDNPASARNGLHSYENQLRTLQLGDDGEDEEEEEDESEEEDEPAQLLSLQVPLPMRRERFQPLLVASPIPEGDEDECAAPRGDGSPSPAPLLSPISATLRSPPWRIHSPNRASASLPLRLANCKRCAQRVFEAEKVVAASEVWHKRCFRCLGCGRSLEPGKFSDRSGEIYCNSCYAKHFGPKGVGCGVGAGILQMHQ